MSPTSTSQTTAQLGACVLLVLAALVADCYGLADREECTAVSGTYTRLGYPSIDVPRRARSDSQLEVCSQDNSCCTREMELTLHRHSRTEFAQRLANTTEFSRTSLITATAKFNEFFLNLLETGQSELDVMFSTAYGLQYKQNKDVFDQLFANFQRYYKGGDISLNDAMNTFFKDVFLRMFVMQNPEYEFNSAYLRCVEVKMDELKPFGTTPNILKKNIRQAFVAARTFVQGLAIGRNVALKMAQVEPTESCSTAYTKQSFCGVCEGLTQLKPCNEYCVNVMRGCLAHHYELNTSWTNYIDAMNGLAERLEGGGSFNIEVVITPLKDMISSAIMEYHGSSKVISEKVFNLKACGIPPPAGRTRNKRGTRTRDRQRSPFYSGKQIKLNELVSDIKAKMRDIRPVWGELPTSMCKGRETASKGSSDCWNGASENRYTKAQAGLGLRANRNNPEVDVVSRDANPLIIDQISELNKATRHLNNAKLGINVDWLDFDVSKSTMTGSEATPEGAEADLPIRHWDSERTSSNDDIKLSSSHDGDIAEQSGSGDLDVQGSDDTDTEPGDDDDFVEMTNPGSGWDSDIVRITPIQRKPNKQSTSRDKTPDDRLTVSEGSGGYDDEGDRPIAIPIPSRPKNENQPYYNGRHGSNDPFVLEEEGSGDTRYIYPTDDEDEIVRPNTGVKYPSETKIINVDDYEDPEISDIQMTTKKSSATSNMHTSLNIFQMSSHSYNSIIITVLVTLVHIIHNAVS